MIAAIPPIQVTHFDSFGDAVVIEFSDGILVRFTATFLRGHAEVDDNRILGNEPEGD